MKVKNKFVRRFDGLARVRASDLRRVTGFLSFLLILSGVVISLVTLYIKPEPEIFFKLSDVRKLAFNFFETLGFTLLTSGVFTIFLQLPDWRNYFEERLKQVVLDQDYLNELDAESLQNLQIKTLKAYFKASDIDRDGSFLNYFQANMSHFISAPFREDVHTEILVEDSDSTGTWISDRIFYTCRMVNEAIQPFVKWRPDKDEFEELKSLAIVIRKPDATDKPIILFEVQGKRRSMVQTYPEVIDRIDQKKILTEGVEVSLGDYQIDGLFVEVRSLYKMRKGKFSSWSMAHPTRNFNVSIKYPEDWALRVQPFLLHPEKVVENAQPGFYSMRYSEWLLPGSSIVYSLVNK